MIKKKTNIETHAWLTATMRNGRKRIETLGWKRLAKLYYAARPGSPIRNRQTHERWMSGTTVVRTFVQDFDVLSVLTEVTEYDGDVGASVLSTQTFTPDPLGRITYSSVSGDGMPTVTLTRTHDANGNLTEVLDNYNGLMTHEYDFINRRVSTTHTEAGAGAAVADKRAEFWYFANGRLETIERFNDAAGDPSALLATTTYAYNYDNTLKTIVHSDLAAGNLSYGYTYGPDGDITQMVTPDDTIDYTLDLRGQVTDVEYDGVELEDYAYDDNGNRTTANGAAYATETGNRMTTDGTYRYQYDDNGNRTLRYVDTDSSGTLNTGDTDITTYAWDYRNRLVTASDQATFGAAVAASVEYIYDAFNNRISKIVDADGDGTAESPVRTNFALLDGEVYLEFNGTTLTHRYMPGPSIDMNLAIEEMHSDGTTHGVLWALTDHQGTVRDVIDSTGAVTNHIQYNSFGHITSQTHGHVNYRFTYTGRELDAETGLYYYRARYYDAENGRFISEDPIAFEAGDANLYRYVGNNPGNGVDPMGLDPIADQQEITKNYVDKYGEAPSPSRRNSYSTGYLRMLEIKGEMADWMSKQSPRTPSLGLRHSRIRLAYISDRYDGTNPARLKAKTQRIARLEASAREYFESGNFAQQCYGSYENIKEVFDSKGGLKGMGLFFGEWLELQLKKQKWHFTHRQDSRELRDLAESLWPKDRGGAVRAATAYSQRASIEAIAAERELRDSFLWKFHNAPHRLGVFGQTLSLGGECGKTLIGIGKGVVYVGGVYWDAWMEDYGLSSCQTGNGKEVVDKLIETADVWREGGSEVAIDDIVNNAPLLGSTKRFVNSFQRFGLTYDTRVEAVRLGTESALIFGPKLVAGKLKQISRNRATANIRSARAMLREAGLPQASINEVIRSFKLDTFRVQERWFGRSEYRYFDDIHAKLDGRYATPEFILDPADRIVKLSLPNNAATRAGTVYIPRGTSVFEGIVAPQYIFGPKLVGGAPQTFILGDLSRINFKEILP